MNKWLIKGVTFLGYSLPYVYLGMKGDITNQSMIFYGLMVIALIVLTITSIRTNHIISCIMGNIASFVASYFLIISNQTEDWSWYFKPFSAIGLLVFMSGLSLAIQIIAILHYKMKYLRPKKK